MKLVNVRMWEKIINLCQVQAFLNTVSKLTESHSYTMSLSLGTPQPSRGTQKGADCLWVPGCQASLPALSCHPREPGQRGTGEGQPQRAWGAWRLKPPQVWVALHSCIVRCKLLSVIAACLVPYF